MAPPIPEDIRRFVLTSIPSVPHVEALLLMRAEEGRWWSAADVAQRLYVHEKTAAALVADLRQGGMAAMRTGDDGAELYSYQPASDFLRTTIDRLAELYGPRLLEITHLIHSKLDRKAQQFADAFKWRKDS